MRRVIWGFSGAIVLVALTAASASTQAPDVVRKNFRLEVTVETDGRYLTGSTVWQLAVQKRPPSRFNYGPQATSVVRGEAIALQLTDRETLFVLRRSNDSLSTDSGGNLLWLCVGGMTVDEEIQHLAEFQGSCEVDLEKGLLEVVSAVDVRGATSPQLGFLESGPDRTGRARIVRQRVEVTDEPITTGLLDRFPWILDLPLPFEKMGERFLEVSRKDVLYRRDFSTEAPNVAQP